MVSIVLQVTQINIQEIKCVICGSTRLINIRRLFCGHYIDQVCLKTLFFQQNYCCPIDNCSFLKGYIFLMNKKRIQQNINKPKTKRQQNISQLIQQKRERRSSNFSNQSSVQPRQRNRRQDQNLNKKHILNQIKQPIGPSLNQLIGPVSFSFNTKLNIPYTNIIHNPTKEIIAQTQNTKKSVSKNFQEMFQQEVKRSEMIEKKFQESNQMINLICFNQVQPKQKTCKQFTIKKSQSKQKKRGTLFQNKGKLMKNIMIDRLYIKNGNQEQKFEDRGEQPFGLSQQVRTIIRDHKKKKQQRRITKQFPLVKIRNPLLNYNIGKK